MDPMDRLDPELVAPLRGLMEATGGGFDLTDIPATRSMVNGMLAAVNAEAPPLPGVETEDRKAPSAARGVEVPIRIYRPTAASGPAQGRTAETESGLPALLWMHPGGYVIGSIEMEHLLTRQLAKDLGCVVVSVDYRLAPEHPYPAALDDCYGVLEWLGRETDALGVDPDRIAVGGSSAGGGLAAALCLRSRDEGGVTPTFQLLLYPAINDRNIEPASATVPENLFWSRENTRISWQSYLAGNAGGDDVPAYAAPLRASDLNGLPDAWIGVGTADMFLQDSIAYAERMAAAGAVVDLAVYPGAFHAFDAFAPASRIAQKLAADRNAALARAFG